MTHRLGPAAVLVAAAVVLATVPVAAVAAGPATAAPAAAPATADASAAAPPNGTNASNSSLGGSISSFMQASAADAEGEVDDGMFVAAFENSSAERRDDLVRKRAGTLEMRLDRLREQRAELLNDSDLPPVARQAKAARLTARIESLRESVNTTDEAAARAGVNARVLGEIRRNASELGGREVADLAGGLVGGPDRGPPADRDSPDERGRSETGADRSGNETDAGGDTGAPGSSGSDDPPANGSGASDGDSADGSDDAGSGGPGNDGESGGSAGAASGDDGDAPGQDRSGSDGDDASTAD